MDPSSSPGWTSYVSLGGLASLGCSGLMWCLYKEEADKAQQLTSIKCHEHLDDLQKLQGRLPQLVALRGRVNCNNPKKCELSDKMAVVHELVEEEVWRKRQENGRTVNEPFVVKKMVERAEWFLEDGISLTHVKVEDVHEAERLSSVMQGRQLFVPDDPGLRSGVARFIQETTWHMVKLGVRKTERCLPVGSIVTVVGQLDNSILGPVRDPSLGAGQQTASPTPHTSASASSSPSSSPPSSSLPSSPPTKGWTLGLDLGGLRSVLPGAPSPAAPSAPALATAAPAARVGGLGQGQEAGLRLLVLRKPPAGSGPFLITPMTMQQLSASVSSTSRIYKYAAVGLGALGAVLVVRKILVPLLRRWRDLQAKRRMAQVQEQVRKRQAERAASTSDASPHGSGQAAEAAQEGDRPANTCVVCIDRASEMVFTSCGHLCCCESCSSVLHRCPVCRVRGTAIKVYRP